MQRIENQLLLIADEKLPNILKNHSKEEEKKQLKSKIQLADLEFSMDEIIMFYV